MARNTKVEKILEAWWKQDHCEPAKLAESEAELNRLLDEIVAQSGGLCNRDQVLDHLFPRYK